MFRGLDIWRSMRRGSFFLSEESPRLKTLKEEVMKDEASVPEVWCPGRKA